MRKRNKKTVAKQFGFVFEEKWDASKFVVAERLDAPAMPVDVAFDSVCWVKELLARPVSEREVSA